MSQLGQLDKDLDKFEKKGAQVIAIAVRMWPKQRRVWKKAELGSQLLPMQTID